MRFQNVTLPHISVRTTGRGLSAGAGLLDTYSVSCPPRCLNIRRQKMSQAISFKKKSQAERAVYYAKRFLHSKLDCTLHT